MDTVLSSPLFNRSSEADAALIAACGRVFAASLERDTTDTPAQRDKVAVESVRSFLDALSKN